MRTLAIGDIHGCYRAFQSLLDAAAVDPKDTLVFLGDYVDRGDQSQAVLQWILDNQGRQRMVLLRGNHEVMMMRAVLSDVDADYWMMFGGEETLMSYGTRPELAWKEAIPPEHWALVEATLPWHETPSHIFVHGGLDGSRDMRDQEEVILYWVRLDEVTPHKSGKPVICGHTVQKSGQPVHKGHIIGIDTGAYQGLWLTCFDVDSGQYWQANESGQIRKGELHPPAGF